MLAAARFVFFGAASCVDFFLREVYRLCVAAGDAAAGVRGREGRRSVFLERLFFLFFRRVCGRSFVTFVALRRTCVVDVSFLGALRCLFCACVSDGRVGGGVLVIFYLSRLRFSGAIWAIVSCRIQFSMIWRRRGRWAVSDMWMRLCGSGFF